MIRPIIMEADVLARMTLEIMFGWEYGDIRTQVPLGPEYEAQWDRLAIQIAEIIAEGYEVQIQTEWPNVNQ